MTILIFNVRAVLETAGQEAKRYNTMCRIVPTKYLPPAYSGGGGEGGLIKRIVENRNWGAILRYIYK